MTQPTDDAPPSPDEVPKASLPQSDGSRDDTTNAAVDELADSAAAENDWSTTVDLCRNELHQQCRQTASALNPSEVPAPILDHGAKALAAIRLASQMLHGGDPDVAHMFKDTYEELMQAYVEAQAGRLPLANSLLRGAFEGIFMSLLYRQQKMSLRLWAEGKAFELAHQLFEDKHHFYQYYSILFSDERYTQQYRSGPSYTKIIDETKKLYKILSSSVHKNRSRTDHEFIILVERVLRISFSFLEREDDLPSDLQFPSPRTFSAVSTKDTKK